MANNDLISYTIPNKFDTFGDDFYQTQISNEKSTPFRFGCLFFSSVDSFGYTKI